MIDLIWCGEIMQNMRKIMLCLYKLLCKGSKSAILRADVGRWYDVSLGFFCVEVIIVVRIAFYRGTLLAFASFRQQALPVVFNIVETTCSSSDTAWWLKGLFTFDCVEVQGVINTVIVFSFFTYRTVHDVCSAIFKEIIEVAGLLYIDAEGRCGGGDQGKAVGFHL